MLGYIEPEDMMDLMNLLAKDADLQDLINKSTSVMNNPLVLVDTNFHILAASTQLAPTNNILWDSTITKTFISDQLIDQMEKEHILGSLRSVDEYRNAVFVGNVSHLPYRVDQSKHVADMRHANHSRTLGEHLPVSLHVYLSVVGYGNGSQSCSHALSLHLPRDDVAVVLHRRDYYLVALANILSAERGSHKVDSLRRSAREDNLLRLLGIDKLAHLLACSLVQVGGLLREIVNSAMHVGIDVEILLTHGIEHLQWLLRRRGIVEIHERAVVDRATEYRKIMTYVVYVVHWLYVLLSVCLNDSSGIRLHVVRKSFREAYHAREQT